MTNEFNSETDPSTNLRSDLWPTMTIGQLSAQQELVMDKLSKLYLFVGQNATPSILNIYGALQVALQDLNALIDSKADKKL